MKAIRISITRWVAGFFIVLSLFIALLCSIGLYRLYEINADLERTRVVAAGRELTEAVAALSLYLDQQREAIAGWDEVRQQLAKPDFYGYWKSSRVRQSGLVSPLFLDFELYDSAGNVLPGGNPRGLLRTSATAAQGFYRRGNANLLTYAFPIHADEDKKQLMGYAEVSFDPVQALKRIHGFNYIDPDSFALSPAAPAALALQDLPRYLGYRVAPSPEISLLEEAVTKTYAILALAMLVSAVTAYLFVQRLLARPLVQLADAIAGLQADEARLDYVEALEAPCMLKELDTVRQSVQSYRQKLSDARLELENKNVIFQQQALQDSLTGLYNRRAFDEDWEKLVKALAGESEPMALLLFDCDHFKPINDTYGHQVGDLVLQTIAGAVSQVMRSGDRLYRIGGDEFATLLWGADEHAALQIAERCLESVRREDFRRLGVQEPVSISIGIAIDEISKGDDLTLLQAHADAAMYQAKRPGNRKIAIYRAGETGSADVLVANLETNALYQALAEPERLEVHYQRMLPLSSGVEYLEALTRIRHGDSLLMPERFLPLVQGRRLDADFDLAVIRRIQACLDAGVLPPQVGISINLSAQSLQRADVVALLIELPRHAEGHPLMLEITETSLVPQLAEITHFLGILRGGGYRIALDDFGSGYSPLRYLADLPVDVIKFDKSLVHELVSGNRTSLVVADFVRMMRDAGYGLIAEGVENEAQLEKARSLGFSYAQGFHIGMPRPIGKNKATVVRLFE